MLLSQIRSLLACGTIALIAGVVSTGAQAQTKPEEYVALRKAMMASAGAHSGAINAVVRGQSNATALVKNHANALAGLFGAVALAFPAGTGPDKVDTKAKAETFTNMADFASKSAATRAEALKLAEIADGGDAAAIQAQFTAVGRTCGGCHTPYRAQ